MPLPLFNNKGVTNTSGNTQSTCTGVTTTSGNTPSTGVTITSGNTPRFLFHS